MNALVKRFYVHGHKNVSVEETQLDGIVACKVSIMMHGEILREMTLTVCTMYNLFMFR